MTIPSLLVVDFISVVSISLLDPQWIFKWKDCWFGLISITDISMIKLRWKRNQYTERNLSRQFPDEILYGFEGVSSWWCTIWNTCYWNISSFHEIHIGKPFVETLWTSKMGTCMYSSSWAYMNYNSHTCVCVRETMCIYDFN